MGQVILECGHVEIVIDEEGNPRADFEGFGNISAFVYGEITNRGDNYADYPQVLLERMSENGTLPTFDLCYGTNDIAYLKSKGSDCVRDLMVNSGISIDR